MACPPVAHRRAPWPVLLASSPTTFTETDYSTPTARPQPSFLRGQTLRDLLDKLALSRLVWDGQLAALCRSQRHPRRRAGAGLRNSLRSPRPMRPTLYIAFAPEEPAMKTSTPDEPVGPPRPPFACPRFPTIGAVADTVVGDVEGGLAPKSLLSISIANRSWLPHHELFRIVPVQRDRPCVGHLCIFRLIKNFRCVLQVCALRTPRQWVDST